MKGYWTNSFYVGFMHDGSKRYFATHGDYVEAYREEEGTTDNGGGFA